MKKKELEQLRNKPKAELEKSLVDNREKLWTLRTDLAAGKVKNVAEIKNVKKMIARLLTVLNQESGIRN